MKFLVERIILKRDYGKNSRPKTGYTGRLLDREVSEVSNV
jgi:hypothetical protein